MERESFENEEIAALMNEHFVSIKVDREERPDLDDIYMAAVQAMTGSGGWPMTVFLTPGLAPFFGGTYFPPEDRHGMPGFPRILDAVADAYRTRRTEVEEQASALADHLRAQLAVPAGTRDVEPRQLEAAVRPARGDVRRRARRLRRRAEVPAADDPRVPAARPGVARATTTTLRMVTRTLDAMADGGIYDQLGGGFARYSTDAHWLVPHFEKMLYDNALLAHAYLEAFRATGEDRYARVARATLDFLLAELRTDDGGFASALDADSEGVEGRFYAWTRDEFMAALADAGLAERDRSALADFWGVTERGNWEGTNVVHVAGADPGAELVERGREALLAARAQRTRPARDEKQIASWNGLALRAFAHGALVLGDESYRAATGTLVAFVERHLVRDGDRLWRTVRDGRGRTPAFAEDYLAVADGLLEAHAALGDAQPLLLARRFVDTAIRDFWDDEAGTFVDTSDEHERTVARPRGLVDNATPSANAIGADVLQRLGLLAGEEDFARRARSIVRAVAPASSISRAPSAGC